MKIIWTFTLLMIPGVMSSIEVTGYSGGGVKISCKYDKIIKKRHEKYFCKGKWSKCTDQIKTEKNIWVKKDRFSLYDDTSSAVFTVTIRDLRERDSGMYYCGTEKLGLDSSTEVNLKVITDQPIRTVRGYSGGNIIINFKYEKKHMNHEKYICKSRECFPVINTNRASEWKHDRRFSVHEGRSAGLLCVFIRELKENDSGEYKITVKVSEDYSFFSEFNLNIEKDDCVKSISLSAAAGGSVNISCKYPQSHSSDVKFLCRRSGADLCAEESSVTKKKKWIRKGKIQLYDDREERLLTGSISHVTEQHSEYWCGVQSDGGHKSFITRVLINLTVFSGSSLIVSLVLLLLVLIIAGLSLLFLCKKRQSPGADSSSHTGPGKHEVVSHTGCDYEDIKGPHKPLPTNPSESSDVLYATAQLPTNPSDSSDVLYATAQLPTNPSDSSDVLYATAQLPTNPSDCDYATVQKAAGDSQCCITSAEDLNYAVVNFHKQSDCPASVSVRNNQDYSEYAAVNHLSA